MPSPSHDPVPPVHYIAYIDESGDPGLSSVQPADPNGSTEWLVLGATVIRAENEPKLVDWVKDIHKAIKSHQGAELHFRKLSDKRRLTACELISGMNLRSFAVLSHKPNMKGHRNPAAEQSLGPRGWFYNWCIRLILERVTDCVLRDSQRVFGQPKHVKLVFSKRGNVLYDWLSAYIEVLMIQSRDGSLYLQKRDIKHQVLHPKLIDVVPHRTSAGCQLADCIASAFYCAANSRGTRWNLMPAQRLKNCMAMEQGHCASYSVVLQPTRPSLMTLTWDQKQIFEFYGYDLR